MATTSSSVGSLRAVAGRRASSGRSPTVTVTVSTSVTVTVTGFAATTALVGGPASPPPPQPAAARTSRHADAARGEGTTGAASARPHRRSTGSAACTAR